MANIEIRFNCESGEGDFLKIREDQGEIIVEMFGENDSFKGDVIFDKSTAIKFAKTLRTEINKIDDSNE